MTRPLPDSTDATAADGSPAEAPAPTPSPEEVARTKAEYNRRRLEEMFENLENAGPPTTTYVGIDEEGNPTGEPPADGADSLQYALDQVLLVKPEGALAAAEQLAEAIEERITGIAAGETQLDPDAAAAALQQLQAAEAALTQLVALLDLHADGLKAHHSNLAREGLIATDSQARAEEARRFQKFLLDTGSLLADLASMADFGESVVESAREQATDLTEAEVKSTLDKMLAADGFYEALKDSESALNTLLSYSDADVDESPIFNDVLGGASFVDEQFGGNPMLAVQTLKSHGSDLVGLLDDYKKGGLKNLNPRTAGQLIIRFAKSYAEWEQELRELQIKELMQSITAIDSVLATPFVPFIATNEQKHLAIDGLVAIQDARLLLHATLVTATPGIGGVDWPTPPNGLTVEQLLLLIATLAVETDTVIDGGTAAALPSTVEEIDAAIAATELARSEVIRRIQTLTSRAAGLDYLEGRERELLADQAAMTRDLIELREKRGRVDFQWAARTPQMPRGPGGRPSYRNGYPPPLVQESPAQLDDQIRNLEADFRSNTEQLGDLRRDQSLLQGELQELPILEGEQSALDAQLVTLGRDRDVQQMTDAIVELAEEEQAEAGGDAALAAVKLAGRSFFSGRWLIAGAVAVIVVGALLAASLLGGGDDGAEEVPASAAGDATANTGGAGTEGGEPTSAAPAVANDAVPVDLLGNFTWYGDGVINFSVEGDRIIGRVKTPGTHSVVNFLVGIGVICPEFVSDVVFDLDLTGHGQWFWYKNLPCERLGGAEVTVSFLATGANARGQQPANHPNFNGNPQGHTMLRTSN